MRNRVSVAVVALVLMLGCVSFEKGDLRMKVVGKGEASVVLPAEEGEPERVVFVKGEGASENLVEMLKPIGVAISNVARGAAALLTGGRVGGTPNVE